MKKVPGYPHSSEENPLTPELSKENITAINQLLDFFSQVAEIKIKLSLEMQTDLRRTYENEWKKFLTAPEGSETKSFDISQDQIAQIKQKIDEWKEKIKSEIKITSSSIFQIENAASELFPLLQNTGLFTNDELYILPGFYEHDAKHVSINHHFVDLLKTHPSRSDKLKYHENEGSISRFKEQLNHFNALIQMSVYPEKWLLQEISQRARSRIKTNTQSQLEPPDLKLAEVQTTTDFIGQIARPIAIALQRRFIRGNYTILINPASEQIPRDDPLIIIQSKLISGRIPLDTSILMSLLYNLAKNAARANEADIINNDSKQNHRIEIVVNETKAGWRFTIADNGIGLNTDNIVQEASWTIQNASPAELKIYRSISGPNVIKKLQAWGSDENPLATRSLTLGQVWDFYKFPRLSGFDKMGIRESSGLGLFGADYIVKNLGGKLVGANRNNGGAVFVLWIPKDLKIGIKKVA